MRPPRFAAGITIGVVITNTTPPSIAGLIAAGCAALCLGWLILIDPPERNHP